MTLFDKFAKQAKASFYGKHAEYELAGKVVRCSHCGHTRFTGAGPFGMVFAVAIFRVVAALECENWARFFGFRKPLECVNRERK